jgi:mevalonate kinase
MPASSAKACAKIILFGEHAVVYGQPAIAIPVTEVHVQVTVNALPNRKDVHIAAHDIRMDSELRELPKVNPIAATLELLLEHFQLDHLPPMDINIRSTIPVASGLGSGASVSTALIRAVSKFMGYILPTEELSEMAFAIEKIHHGNPSGIDNTVIAYGKPIFFRKEKPFAFIRPSKPMTFLIAVGRTPSLTREVVNEVQRRYLQDPEKMGSLFDTIGDISISARRFIQNGDLRNVGQLMNENQRVLNDLNVSSPELEKMIAAARQNGALGAKLSGAGKGGNIIALCEENNFDRIHHALVASGAIKVIRTDLQADGRHGK